jgi:hypothetical protein
VTTTSRKIRVRAASRIARAISLGVFCRLAPSTIAIMRSRKLCPGRVVTRTTSQSDMMRVPPVTALRSPPLSRTTGALSPVTALSSTDATPSRASPSAGITSPALTYTRSPTRRSAAGTSVVSRDFGSVSRRAVTWVRDFRMDAAWALPCPSAMASAKLANSTVAHSQTATPRTNADDSPAPSDSDRTHDIVVRMLPR